jgi:hypothetical protein
MDPVTNEQIEEIINQIEIAETYGEFDLLEKLLIKIFILREQKIRTSNNCDNHEYLK